MFYIIALITYLVSVFIYDKLSIFPVLAVAASYVLVYGRKKAVAAEAVTGEKKKSMPITGYVLFVTICEFFFSYYLRIAHRDIFDMGGFSIGKITIVNTFVIYIELISVFIYYMFLRRKNIFRTDKKALIFIAVMMTAFLIRDCMYSGYESFVSGNSYDTAECFELFLRAFLLAAFTEELLFRGMIFDELCEHYSWQSAAVIQSLLFTFVHSERWLDLIRSGDLSIAANLCMVFVMGFLSAFLRKKTGSIVPSILMHGALNGGIYDLFLALYSI